MAETVTVEGMACDGCEETVEETLEDVEGVTRAEADYTQDEVEIEGDFETEAAEKAVEDAGYEVS